MKQYLSKKKIVHHTMAYIDICPVCPARSAWQGCLPCLLPCWRCFATSIRLSCSGPCTLSFAFSCNSSTAQVIRIIMGCALLVAVAQHGQARQGTPCSARQGDPGCRRLQLLKFHRFHIRVACSRGLVTASYLQFCLLCRQICCQQPCFRLMKARDFDVSKHENTHSFLIEKFS